MAAAAAKDTKKKETEQPIPGRPVLPEDPTREQLSEAINALRVWFAQLKTVTRRHAIKAQQGSSGRGGFCSDGLNGFLERMGLPQAHISRYTPVGRTELERVIDPEPPLSESHYTDKGLRYHWDTLTAQVEEWLTKVRAEAIAAHNDGHITLNRLHAFLRVTGQEPPREAWAVNACPEITWNQDEAPDRVQLAAAFKAASEAFIAEAGIIEGKVRVNVYADKRIV